MIRAINSLSPVWQVVAYTILGLGLVFVLGFLVRYTTNLPWRISKEGRHLVAMSANILAFLLIYFVQAFIPDWPWRQYALIVLLVALVANCGWRWWILEKHLRRRRQGHE